MRIFQVKEEVVNLKAEEIELAKKQVRRFNMFKAILEIKAGELIAVMLYREGRYLQSAIHIKRLEAGLNLFQLF